jgi:hypothetical protein
MTISYCLRVKPAPLHLEAAPHIHTPQELCGKAILPCAEVHQVKAMLRPTVSWPVCLDVSDPQPSCILFFKLSLQVVDLLMWGALSDERTGQ